ncbi:MAG: Ca-activated chloride channel family protein [Saprospiraceae bacterium]
MVEFIKNISYSWFGDPDFFRFQQTGMFWGFLILFLLSLWYWYQKRVRKKKLKQFTDLGNEGFLFPTKITRRASFKMMIWLFGMSFLLMGLSNPQFGSKKEEVKQKGVDLVFALDVSKSMLAEDIKPNRLERAKHAISKIIDRLGADRIAIVIFAGDAYLQLPLTSDHGAAKMYLSEISTSMIPVGGTSVAAALKKSIKAFSKEKTKGRAIILITDGENHDEEALEIAKSCGEQEINIYSLGIGTTKGSTIPEYLNGKKVGLQKDKSGSTIVTKINEDLLMSLADLSNGKYVRSSNQNLGLSYLFDQIRGMDQEEYGAKKFSLYEHRFVYFLLIGFGLLVLELFIFSNKVKIKSES